MKKVIFQMIKKPGSNLVAYPDEKQKFKNAHPDMKGNIIADYFGDLELTLYSSVIEKSIHTKGDFIAMIPKEKVRSIQTASATNDDINVWVFNLPMMDVINLNNLPVWFIEGLQAMVTEGIFTQTQINNFLEL